MPLVALEVIYRYDEIAVGLHLHFHLFVRSLVGHVTLRLVYRLRVKANNAFAHFLFITMQASSYPVLVLILFL
jgi:hypothetical protein